MDGGMRMCGWYTGAVARGTRRRIQIGTAVNDMPSIRSFATLDPAPVPCCGLCRNEGTERTAGTDETAHPTIDGRLGRGIARRLRLPAGGRRRPAGCRGRLPGRSVQGRCRGASDLRRRRARSERSAEGAPCRSPSGGHGPGGAEPRPQGRNGRGPPGPRPDRPPGSRRRGAPRAGRGRGAPLPRSRRAHPCVRIRRRRQSILRSSPSCTRDRGRRFRWAVDAVGERLRSLDADRGTRSRGRGRVGSVGARTATGSSDGCPRGARGRPAPADDAAGPARSFRKGLLRNAVPGACFVFPARRGSATGTGASAFDRRARGRGGARPTSSERLCFGAGDRDRGRRLLRGLIGWEGPACGGAWIRPSAFDPIRGRRAGRRSSGRSNRQALVDRRRAFSVPAQVSAGLAVPRGSGVDRPVRASAYPTELLMPIGPSSWLGTRHSWQSLSLRSFSSPNTESPQSNR